MTWFCPIVESIPIIIASKLVEINNSGMHLMILSTRILPTTIISVVLFAYGIKITRALLSAMKFYHAKGKNVFVFGLIFTAMIGQITKFILTMVLGDS